MLSAIQGTSAKKVGITKKATNKTKPARKPLKSKATNRPPTVRAEKSRRNSQADADADGLISPELIAAAAAVHSQVSYDVPIQAPYGATLGEAMQDAPSIPGDWEVMEAHHDVLVELSSLAKEREAAREVLRNAEAKARSTAAAQQSAECALQTLEAATATHRALITELRARTAEDARPMRPRARLETLSKLAFEESTAAAVQARADAVRADLPRLASCAQVAEAAVEAARAAEQLAAWKFSVVADIAEGFPLAMMQLAVMLGILHPAALRA